MVVQHNLTAMNANRYLGINNSKLSKSLEKLSSGYAINRAGDNAAGLAVSEKMRSQIAGLTQGVKNAQDGISMIQTFEGALTETDSILQRMKTLADQSANGTYQDDVDRDAIQLEFDQLNDELNQIADTDFNGVVVLNGGEMADGLKAVDGKFDYAKGQAPTIAAATAEAVDLTSTKRDPADGVGMNVDDSAYGNKAANALWSALGLTSDANDLNVTFIKGTDADGNTEWTIGAAVASAGTPDIPATAATAESGVSDATGIANTTVDDDAMLAWLKGAGLDTTQDAVITFTRSAGNATTGTWTISADYNDGTTATITAPGATKNADMITAGITTTATAAGTVTFDYKAATAGTEAVKGSNVKEDITAKADNALTITEVNAKDGASGDGGFIVSWKGADGQDYSVNVVSNSVDAKDGDYITVNFKPSALKAPTNLGVYEDKKDAAGKNVGVEIVHGANSTGTLTKDGVDIEITLDNTVLNDGTMNKYFNDILEKLTQTEITFTTADATNGTDAKFTATGADEVVDEPNGNQPTGNTGDFTITDKGNGEMTIGYAISDGAGTVTTVDFATVKVTTTGAGDADQIKFSLKPSAFKYSDAADLRARSVETTEAQKEIFDKNTKKEAESVSQSNAFKQATAPLTYTDHIILQTGARTKDAVDFTFKYTSGGMGDLKSNMNCSAREDGLNTASLSLRTAEEANYAIDRIDNAINKVSMVRATFGAVQNRLEHKIDNMNVTIENITSAESGIRDTNMPQEMMNFTKQQILAQASQSMLAQANQLPQSVLSLLQ